MAERPRGQDGKRKRVMRISKIPGPKGEKEVWKALKPFVDGEQIVSSTTSTVGELCDLVLASRSVGEDAIRQNTKKNYSYIVESLIKPFIGGQQVAKLQDYHLNQYFDALKLAGKKERVRQMAWVFLNSALLYAKKKKMIVSNPLEDVAKPKLKKSEIQCMDKEEIQRFLRTIRAEDQFPLFFLALYGGMRIGEILALQWDDIDFTTGVLTVRHTLMEVESGVITTGYPCPCGCGATDGRSVPKTDAGFMRPIELTEELLASLRKQQERLMGLGLRACPWVFPNGTGGPLLQGNVRKLLKRFLKQAKITKHIRFHDLRHSAATLMLTVGADTQMIQQRLGHANQQMMARYVHAVKEHESIIKAKMAGVFAGVGQ